MESPEEFEGVGDNSSANAATVKVQILVEASLNTSLRSASFIDEIFFGKNTTSDFRTPFCSAGLSGLRITGRLVKGIFL